MSENLSQTSLVSVSYGSMMAGLFRHTETENAVSYATLDRASTAVANMPGNVRKTLLMPIEQEIVNPQNAYCVIDDLGMGGAGGKSIVISAEDFLRLIASVPSPSPQSRWVIGDDKDDKTKPPRFLNALHLMANRFDASIKRENSAIGRISATHNEDPEKGAYPCCGRYASRHTKFLFVSFFALLGFTVVAALAILLLRHIVTLPPEEPQEQESITTSNATQQRKYLPGTIFEWNDFEYIHHKEPLKWIIARKNCILWGGDLVSIHSEEENNFISSLHQCTTKMCSQYCDPNSPRCKPFELWIWIGLNDQSEEGSFDWTDGTSNDFTAWDTSVLPHEPNNGVGAKHNGVQTAQNCVVQSDYNGKWYDGRCDLSYQSICKRRKI